LTTTFFFWAWSGVNYFIFVKVFRQPDDGRAVHPVAQRWGRTIFGMTPGWSITIDGQENLPKDRTPMVIVANHQSMTDIFVMYFLGVQFRWLSKDEVFKLPLIGWSMRWAHYVPVRRGARDSHAQALRESEGRLREGLSMLFFPEGTRSSDGHIKEFKLGAFKVARDTQTPVLPVALDGAHRLLPKGGKIPQRAAVRIRILRPQPPPRPDEDLRSYAEATRQRIITAHAEVTGAKAD
jgi:1-acyl-sn-glycerol-3-phosphate acyltransferase